MRRPHYAWIICLGCAVSAAVTIGLGVNIFSVYQPYIIALNDFTNAQGSWITTTRSLFILLAMMSVNQLVARIGLRQTITLGLLLMICSCVGFALSRSFLSYCVSGALTGLAYGYAGMVPVSLAIGHWYRDQRGFALGLASAGTGIPTILAPPVLTRIIEGRSMRDALLLEALLILILTILVWLIIRDRPEDLGLEPYHRGDQNAPAPPLTPAPRGMHPMLWWGVLFSVFLLGAPAGPGFSHITVLYTSSGLDSMLVAALLSYLGLMLCLGKVLCGWVFDVLGGWRGNFYIFGIFFVSLLLCCLAPYSGVLLSFITMTLFGLGVPISAISLAIWAEDLCGSAGYESAVRSLTAALSLGMLVFGPVPGMLADRFGSYVPAYGLFAATLLVSFGLLQYAYFKLNLHH